MENMKFLQARDSILAFMLAQGFKKEEIKTVLQMCDDEITAWEKRSKIVKFKKEGEDDGKTID